MERDQASKFVNDLLRLMISRNGSDLFLTAEFGTYGAIRVIGALRSENRAYHWGKPSSQVVRRVKERVRETFVPSSPAWREMVIASSLAVIQKAFHAAGSSPLSC